MYGSLENFWGIENGKTILQHLTSMDLKSKLNKQIWEEFFKFSVVRNPWSKAVSEYQWYLRHGPFLEFQEWVATLERRIEINGSIHFYEVGHNLPQVTFLYDTNKQVLVDKIIKFETLNEEFTKLCHEKNWEFTLIHSDTTRSLINCDFRELYCEQSADQVQKIYSLDIRLFGYSKDETFADISLPKKPVTLDTVFDPRRYLNINEDVKKAKVDPFEPFIRHGRFEGRMLL